MNQGESVPQPARMTCVAVSKERILEHHIPAAYLALEDVITYLDIQSYTCRVRTDS